jgi:hypothetical protein
MTGATCTARGGGGADARTLLFVQPSAFSSNTVPNKPADILFIFIFSFPFLITSLARLKGDAVRFAVQYATRSSSSIQARQSRDCICQLKKSGSRKSYPAIVICLTRRMFYCCP